MGMDVYGKNPTSKVGKYFRRNVWGWHPLWGYVEDVHPEIASLVKYGHSNDGDGLDEEDSRRLAELLTTDLEIGLVDKYVEERNKALADLPLEPCGLCDSTGIRTDKVGLESGMPDKELSPEMKILTGREKGWCNACNGQGESAPWATNYSLEPTDVKEFTEFLRDCGGFEIC
jgi:hypothetical protein